MNQFVNIIKQSILIVFIACFFVQTTFAQAIEQINCSGILQENGQLITGSRNLTFSIEDTDWTQTITDVPIQEGVYFVKLDAPASDFLSLYLENKQANLEISVDGTPLTPTTTMLWVPYALIAKTAIDTQKIAGHPVSGTPQKNFVLKWDGTAWIPSPDQTGESGITTESDPEWSKASSSYYNITDLQTSGSAQVHWDNLNNVPSDIKDGDNVGLTSLSGHNATELDDINSSGSGSIITDAERNKLNGIETSADKTDAQNVASAGAVMDSDFSSNGIMKRTSSGSYSILGDSSSNWNTAYSERRYWDGGNLGLNASTGRTSLGLGSAATRNYENSVSNSSNLPTGSAVMSYVSSRIPNTSSFITTSGGQTINGNLNLSQNFQLDGDLFFRDSSNRTYAYFEKDSEGLLLRVQEPSYTSNTDYIIFDARVRTLWTIDAEGGIEIPGGEDIIFKNPSNSAGSYMFKSDSSAMNFYAWSYPSLFKFHTSIEVTGSAKKPGGGSWSTNSDIRLKDIKQDFNRGIEAIMQINPKIYNYKEGNPLDLPSENSFVGVIAQEVKDVIPEAVEEGEYLTVNNDPILWTMVNSIKQLSTLNKELKNENESLKQELSQIKEMIAEIQQSLILN